MTISDLNNTISMSIRGRRFLSDEKINSTFKFFILLYGVRIDERLSFAIASKFIVILLFLAVFSANGLAQVVSRDSTLTAIESLYNSGQYLFAELEARRTLEEPDLNDSTKVQIEKWIAFSLIAQGKSAIAKERFILLFRIDDAFELDPVLTSPKILSVFNDAKSKFIAQKKSAPPDTTSLSVEHSTESSTISFRTIVFPGWEQIHQNRTGSGYMFLGAGAVTLASGFAFEFLRSGAREDYLQASSVSEISSKYDTYNTYRKAEIYSFTAFALIYIVSEIDVFTGSNMNIQSAYSIRGGNQMVFTVRF